MTVRSVKNIRLSHPLVSVVLATGPAPEPEPAEAMVPISQVEEARKAGYQGGFEAASAAIEAQLVEQRSEVTHLQQKVFDALTSHHDTLTRQLRSAVPELAMEAVRRVIAGVEPDQASVERIVAEMLQEITPGPEVIEVCLSGRDLGLVESYQPTLRERYPQIQFRADPDLRPGDCVVNSRFGSLDGRLATKLRSIERLLQ